MSVASEVFVGVVRGLESFQGDEAAFRSWLLVIAHRRLLDERRRLGRKPAEAVQPHRLHEVPDPDEFADVEQAALARLGTTRVLDALEQLTDDQRTVVLLHTVGEPFLSLDDDMVCTIARLPEGSSSALDTRTPSDESLAKLAEMRMGVSATLIRDVLATSSDGQSTIADPSHLLGRYIDASQKIWEYVDRWRSLQC